MASITITEEDNSLSVAGSGDIKAGMVIIADRGRVDEAVSVDKNTIIGLYGKPNPSKSTTHYSAMFYLEKASNMYVARCIHNAEDGSVETDTNRTARYAAALVRHTVSSLPSDVPDANYEPDRIIEPYANYIGSEFGLTQAEVDSFEFPVYSRDREFETLSNKISAGTTNQSYIVVDSFDGLQPGDNITFDASPSDTSTLYEIKELNLVTEKIPQITIEPCGSSLISVSAGTLIRRVYINNVSYDTAVTTTVAHSTGSTVIKVSSVDGIESGHTVIIGDNTAVVQSISEEDLTITLRTGLTSAVVSGTEVIYAQRTYETVTNNPSALRDASGSDVILMTDSDHILNNNRYTFMSGITNDETEFIVTKKNIYNEEQNQVTLDASVSVTTDTVISKMTASEFEERDVLLLIADNQGSWGSDVTVKITESSDYPDDCRIITVYENGVATGESFEVAFTDFVDGLGKQRYVEDVINGNSNYIRVKHNTNAVDSDGKPLLPLINNYSIWREDSEDIFTGTGKTIAEDLVYGDTDIVVSDYSGFELGNRIKFGEYDEEYKITGKSASQFTNGNESVIEYHLTIDRGIEVDRIESGSEISLYDHTEYKPVQKISGSTFPSYSINQAYTISGVTGVLLDCGANKMDGGHNGSTPDVADMISTLNKVFSNKEKLEVNILLDGGVYSTSYQQELDTIAQNRQDCFAYLSGDPSIFDSTDPLSAAIEFRENQSINSSYSGTFVDWVEIYCEYNKKNVQVSTDGLAAALQSVASQGGVWGELAAGWNSGVLFNVLKPVHIWSESDRDELLNVQLNPIKKYKTLGMSIWGNKTNLGTRSYLQMRNVRFLLIQLNVILRETLEYYHFTFNTEERRSLLCTTLQETFWNRFNSILEDLKVYDKTTSTDVDDGILRLYVGVQPNGVVEDINVTIGVFSATNTITVE